MNAFPFRIISSAAMPPGRAMLISELSEDELAEVRKRVAAGEDPVTAYAEVLAEKRKVAMIVGIGT